MRQRTTHLLDQSPGRTLRPRPTRRELVVADPPEAGWRFRTRTNEEATAEAEMLAAPAHLAGCAAAI